MPQIWAAAAEAEADPGDLILQSHRSWGPITDVIVSLLNPDREVMVPHGPQTSAEAARLTDFCWIMFELFKALT